MKRHHANEGMEGISPRYVMNRLSTVAASQNVCCVSPLSGLNSLWEGLREHVALDDADHIRYIDLMKDTVQEHNRRAIDAVQKASTPSFEQSALEVQAEYLGAVEEHLSGGGANSREMREMEKHAGVPDRRRGTFRGEMHDFYTRLKERGVSYDYSIEPRLKAAVEARLLPTRRQLERSLTMPRFAKQRVEWRRRRGDIARRLTSQYGFCGICAEDTIEYVAHVLKSRSVIRTPKNEGVEWQWELNPRGPESSEAPC